jgi:hypothetical protein
MIPDEDNTNQDDANQDTGDAAPRSKMQTIAGEYKMLTASGFSKQQIAQQLSVKHNITVDDVTRMLDQCDDNPDLDKA